MIIQGGFNIINIIFRDYYLYYFAIEESHFTQQLKQKMTFPNIFFGAGTDLTIIFSKFLFDFVIGGKLVS